MGKGHLLYIYKGLLVYCFANCKHSLVLMSIATAVFVVGLIGKVVGVQ